MSSVASAGIAHEAYLYADPSDLIGQMAVFVDEGLRAGERVLVVVTPAKADALRSALNGRPKGVTFVDSTTAGRNPGRVISIWRDWVGAHGHRGGVRGIGEPIWPGRTPSELTECHHHESLLNLAFGSGPSWRMLCPYDTAALPAETVQRARTTHPVVSDAAGPAASQAYTTDYGQVLRDRLSDAPVEREAEHLFEMADLPAIRRLVASLASRSEAEPRRRSDFVTAVNEVATNSIRHGGGAGRLTAWWTQDSLICQIDDRGYIDSPLIGRQRPSPGPGGGYGLWLVHQLCDLVQLRSDPTTGTVVRMHLNGGPS
ncbi:MAG: sensor histidine kinase [Sporichthyaceae bacterium]|nr:sensor histidine kinase [Sporichthyaceae bacterium]